MRRTRSFAGKTAIVTGGASGIGLALGRRLAEQGAAVTLADIDGEGAMARAAEIDHDLGTSRATGVALDVRDEAAFRRVVDDAAAATGSLDLLCNNAGISMGGPTHEMTSAHWRRIIDVNLLGVVHGILAAYPRMVAQGHGQIVNTASGVGLVAPPFVTAYAATKHAVVGLSTGLRPEAARHGVTVSVLCPGSVETPILDRLPDPDLPERDSPPATGRDYAGVLGVTPMPAEDFAARALPSIARGKAVIIEPPSIRVLWYLDRLSPRLTALVNRRLAAKVDRELLHPDGA